MHFFPLSHLQVNEEYKIMSKLRMKGIERENDREKKRGVKECLMENLEWKNENMG